MLHSFFSRAAVALAVMLMASFFAGCSTPKQPPMPVGNLKLGVAPFTQPKEPHDMLAGYLVEDAPQIDSKNLNEMDGLFAEILAKNSQNKFAGREDSFACIRTVKAGKGNSNNQAALRTWSAIGRCMNVDILVVPQLLDLRERDGGAMGAVSPARVVMDIFVLDVRNESLISRSRFDETQSALSSNLLDAGKFFKRGGKWITAAELAQEGMEKAVKELGL